MYNMVVDSIINLLGKNKDEISPDTNMVEELQMDSLDAVDILCDIEEKIGFEIIENGNEEQKQAFYNTMRHSNLQEFVKLLTNLAIEKSKHHE